MFLYFISRSVANPNRGFQIQLQDFEQYKLTEVIQCFVLHCFVESPNGFLSLQERRRLKERFPTLAMETSDKYQCIVALSSYEQLLSNNDICEGNCARGRQCPTGVGSLYSTSLAVIIFIDHSSVPSNIFHSLYIYVHSHGFLYNYIYHFQNYMLHSNRMLRLFALNILDEIKKCESRYWHQCSAA